MVKVHKNNAMVKGYHEFQIRSLLDLSLPVTKKYGNNYDPNACLAWVPELTSVQQSMWNTITDDKRAERVRTIAGLPMG